MDVMSELEKIGPLFTSGEYQSGLQEVEEFWQRIPTPKQDVSNAYLVLEYGVAFALKAGSLDEAQKWAALAPPFAAKRHDRGEVEFLLGRVALERGDREAAHEHFLVAKRKSKGRVFQGQDPKYKALVQ